MHQKGLSGWLALVFFFAFFFDAYTKADAPAIKTLLKASVYEKVIKDRDTVAYASLDPVRGPAGLPGYKKYSFYAAMLVHSNLAVTRQILTNYKLYAEMIPYIDKAQYSESAKILAIEGGIWNFKLISEVIFTEVSDRWIQFEIIKGHFFGLKGNLYFDNLGEKGTIVYLEGNILGKKWPPAFIVERGAEIVFRFTGSKMRSYIESKKYETIVKGDNTHGEPKVPEPKRRF
ncbi:MAG: hypothetical protein HY843_07905 [Bdellovibrio sp.]|nr:hypothetical protein [Bdellovibrio sp.]